jgi:hypothetical protein
MNSPRIQYTIRQVPQNVNEALRKRVQDERKSMNSVLIDILERGLGIKGAPVYHTDLDDLAGTWVDDPEFDIVIEALDHLDQESGS